MSDAPINTSIYDQLKPPAPINPLGTIQTLQDIQGKGIENQQNMMNLQAKQALSQIAQQSIDPDTGQMDENKFIQGVWKNPQTAFMGSELASAQVARKLQGAQLSLDQIAAAHSTMDYVSQRLGALYNNPNLDPDMIRSTVNDITSHTDPSGNGMGGMDIISPSAATKWLSTLPTEDAYKMGDPIKNQTDLKQRLADLISMSEVTMGGLKMITPNNTPIQTGGATQIMNTNPNSPGGQVAGTTIGNTPTPGEAINPVGITNPSGSTSQVPGGLIANKLGLGGVTGPGAAQFPNGGAPTGGSLNLSPPGTSQVGSPGDVDKNGKFDPVPPPPSPQEKQGALSALTSGNAKGPSPAQVEAQKTQAETWNTALTDNAQKQEQTQQLSMLMQQEQQALKNYQAGPGAASRNALARVVRSVGTFLGPQASQDMNNWADNFLGGKTSQDAAAVSDFLQSTNAEYVNQKYKNTFGTQGSTADYQSLIDNMSLATKSPDAINAIYNMTTSQAKYLEQRGQAMSQMTQNWAQNGHIPDYNTFETRFLPYAQQHLGFSGPTQNQTPVATPLGGYQPAAPSGIQKYGPGEYPYFDKKTGKHLVVKQGPNNQAVYVRDDN